MAIASWMIRGRSLRHRRLERSRFDSDDENVQLDLSKDPKENIQEILRHVCQRHGVVEGKRLGYLNAFVKLVSQLDVDQTQLGYTKEELLCCLRTALVHEATQVRAAGLRAIRYLLTSESDVLLLNKLQVPALIARSLDLSLRNDMERIQAVRMMRRLLAVCPAEFPVALVRCLVSLANGAAEANDRMLRVSLAVLCEICVLNPFLLLKCGGITSLVRNVLDCGLPRIAEALVGCLLFLLDRPDTRAQARLDLQSLAEPYCDIYFRKPPSTSGDRSKDEREIKERELRLRSSHLALLSILRSWPGLLHFCSPRGNSGLRAIVDVLYLKQLDVRKAVLDLLYDLLGIPLPEWTDELSVALDAVDPSHPQDSWRLHEGFVAAEGRSVLPHLSKYRPNIVVNHLAVLLHAFLEAGLLTAIVEVIVSEDTFLSVRATILLGQLLHLMHLLLPSECCNVTPSLPTLMWYAVGASRLDSHPPLSENIRAWMKEFGNLKQEESMPVAPPAIIVTNNNQQQALASVAAMNQLHRLLKRRPAPASLFLAQVLNSASRYHKEERRAIREVTQAGDTSGSPNVSASTASSSGRRRRLSESVLGFTSRGRPSKSKLQQMVAKESEDALKESCVLTNKDVFSWNWDIVRTILKSGSEALVKLEDSNHRTFIKRLIHYYKPSSNRFSRVELGGNRKQTNVYTLAGIELIDVLLNAEEVEGSRLLGEFLGDLCTQIEAITTAKSAHDCLLSPQHTSNSLCQDYFLFVGHLCQTSKGLKALESAGLLNLLLHLVMVTNHDCYVKLVVSSLDYAAPAMPRTILETVLTAGSESSRLYATQFLVVLLRARVPHFHEWGLALLLRQLQDSSKAVRLAAQVVLDEACDDLFFLQSLAELKPEFNIANDQELLLQIRLLSVPLGFSRLEQTGFVSAQLNHWASEFNYRYVRLVEGEIHDSLSLHQRGEDGHYSRRVSSVQHCVKDVFIPPHLYGQLSLLPQGYQLLLQDPRVHVLLKAVCSQQCSTEQEVLELKSALWAAGHISTSSLGAQWLGRQGVVSSAVTLAQSCPVYSVRATAFYVLGLVATTSVGADILLESGWMSVRHHRHERWPVILQNLSSSCMQSQSTPDDDFNSQIVADDTETESSIVTEEDDSSLWDDSASRNGVQFWNEASPASGDALAHRKARTLPHQRAAPEWPRKQQRSLSESQSESPQAQRIDSPASLSFTTSSSPPAALLRESSPSLPPPPPSQTPPLVPAGENSASPSISKPTDDSKSRSNSCTDSSTSGVSSCESALAKQVVSERVQTLSPIPSYTSLNTLKSTAMAGPPASLVTPLTAMQQDKQHRRTSLQGSTTSDHASPTHSVLSARFSHQDVAGYATLRSLQRQQRPYLPSHIGIADDFLDDLQLLSSSSSSRERKGTSSLLSSMRRLKVRSLDRQTSYPLFYHFDPKLSNDVLHPPVAASSPARSIQHKLAPLHNQCYMGIALPLSLCALLPLPQRSNHNSQDTNEAHPDTNATRSLRLGDHVTESQTVTHAENRERRRASLSFSEMESVQEAGEESEPPHSSQPSSESEDDIESEEGVGGSRIERDRGRGFRRSCRSSRSGRGMRMHVHKRRERAAGLTYTEVRTYHHQPSCCLICSLRQQQPCSGNFRERKTSAGSYYVRTRTETESSCGTTETTESPSRQRTISVGAFGGSVESTTSIDTIGSAQDDSCGGGKSKVMVRAEVMRLVECMSNPMWIKIGKQAILQAKQKYPQMLDDICLYSDICECLASCSYRLQARRFLQEVFLDMSFVEVYDEAVNILKLAPQGLSTESTHTRSISVSLPPSETLVATGAVKVVDPVHPPPLSMVLEELSGSEGRRGSCTSSAQGSLPKHIEVITNVLNITGGRVPTSCNISVPTVKQEATHLLPSTKTDEFAVSRMCDNKTENCTNDSSSSAIIPHNDGPEVETANSSGDETSLGPSTSTDKCNTDSYPQKKTVFSLLSQRDVTFVAKRRGDTDKSVKITSDIGANGEGLLPCKGPPGLEDDQPRSPVRLFSCRLQSGDCEDIGLRHTDNTDLSSDRTLQLSPARIRKVATVCQPTMAILESGSQSKS